MFNARNTICLFKSLEHKMLELRLLWKQNKELNLVQLQHIRSIKTAGFTTMRIKQL